MKYNNASQYPIKNAQFKAPNLNTFSPNHMTSVNSEFRDDSFHACLKFVVRNRVENLTRTLNKFKDRTSDRARKMITTDKSLRLAVKLGKAVRCNTNY